VTIPLIRPARREDCPLLLELVTELAEFEHARDEVHASPADFERDGFGPEPRFEALIAETERGAAGFALWFHSYSTWDGRAGVFIEDLYVRPWARGFGVGRALVAEVAALAQQRGCLRLELNVLDWNPARGFYHTLGLEQRASWLPYRLSGPALARLAATAPRLSQTLPQTPPTA